MEAGLTRDHCLDRIDWKAPWLAGWHAIAEPILQNVNWRTGLNQLAQTKRLCNYNGLPIHFVPQAELPPGIAYEAFIGSTGCIPTRDNLHDFFNALAWLAYPQMKMQLNALQAGEIAHSAAQVQDGQVNAPRGKQRDAATIFDENVALFISVDEKLNSALRAHRWAELFVEHKAAFERTCSVRLFGHALMEKLIAPYKAITAHAWIVTVGPEFLGLPEAVQRARLDNMVGRRMVHGFNTSDFTPLPVLGVPGWAAEQDDAYYADQSVFRPRRSSHIAYS